MVHVVATPDIDPHAPAMGPITSSKSVEVWYDASRQRTHTVLRRGTMVTLDSVEDILPPNVPPVGTPAPLYEFVTGYRSALIHGMYRVQRSDRVEGRRVLWLTAPTVSDPVDVAVDPVSFRPLWLRSLDSDLLTQLSLAETEPYDPADFLTAKQREASA